MVGYLQKLIGMIKTTMNLDKLSPGKNIPTDINVVIEIPSNTSPIKYELDKESGMLMVDRFLGTSMFYPCEYGFIPNTLSEDGDPIDVLVIAPYSLLSGSVIRCRPIGVLRMIDESGKDAKILAVPVNKLTTRYQNISKPEDVDIGLLESIKHFFSHYKDLEPGKWVKVGDWEGPDASYKEIIDSIERYNSKK